MLPAAILAAGLLATAAGCGGRWDKKRFPDVGVLFWAASPELAWFVSLNFDSGLGEPVPRRYEDGAWRVDEQLASLVPRSASGTRKPIVGPIWGTSARDVWIGVKYHFDGERWSRKKGIPAHNKALSSYGSPLWGSSPSNYYALVRNYGPGPRTLYSHYNGKRWSTLRAVPGSDADSDPGAAGLASVHGSGPDDIHIVGGNDQLLHYDGRRWRRLAAPTTSGFGFYNSVRAFSPTWAYAFGGVFGGAPGEQLLVEYDGTRWKRIPVPRVHLVGAKRCDDGRLYATDPGVKSVLEKTLYEKLPGDSSWHEVPWQPPGAGVRAWFCLDNRLIVHFVTRTIGINGLDRGESEIWIER